MNRLFQQLFQHLLQIWRWLFSLLRRGRYEREMEEEMRFHLEMQIEQNLASGMAAEEAHYAARRQFGNQTWLKEVSREMWGLTSVETLIQDLRFSARMLRKNPGFTLIAVVTLALGIGANTAIFSVVHALTLRPLPYHEPDRLALMSREGRNAIRRMAISYPNYNDWRERAQSFEGMASSRSTSFNLTGVERAARLRGQMVNWNFFQLLGIQPQLGRLFVSEDDRYGAPRTAILSHGMWLEKFGGDAGIIGRKLLLDGDPYEVIGVLPPGFEYFRADDVYVPIGLVLGLKTGFYAGIMDRGAEYNLFALARLKPGVTIEQAKQEMASVSAQLEREYPAANKGKNAQVEPLQDVMSDNVRQSLWVLMGAVGFILLIACVNVANLLLAKTAERKKEIAVRLALGAPARRIMRQMLSESLLLALLGGALAVLIGRWMLAGLLALAPNNIPQLGRVSLSGAALLFTFGVSVLTSVLCGLLPAWQASGADLQTALKEGGRSDSGAGREAMRKSLVVVEVSLALALLIGAGLLVRSMARALNVDPGFNPDRLLTMRVELPENAYDTARRRAFLDECLARVSALPGIRSAAITFALPIDGSQWNLGFSAVNKNGVQRGGTSISPVSADYFAVMGIRLLQGRVFNSTDTADSARVSIINEALAQRIWPGANPIGQRLKWGSPDSDSPWMEVVGVVADVKLNGVERETPIQTYLPFAQHPTGLQWLVARTTGEPMQVAASVERAIHEIDRDLPVVSIRSMNQLMAISLAARRLTLVLLMSFAALALLLAGIGIYGVVSYSVKQRTRELGIRVALGAQAGDVLKLILAQGLKLALIGVVIGLAAAFALTRWMESLLFGVRPTDPLTFGVVAVVLLCVSLLACWIPARRATKVDPMVALRIE
jgi:putative ABC transport system permease protein